MKAMILALAAVGALVLCGCEDRGTTNGPPAGSAGGPCRPGGGCDDGLTCLSGRCVQVPDAGARPAGTEGGQCKVGRTCNKGLICLSGLCVKVADAGPSQDSKPDADGGLDSGADLLITDLPSSCSGHAQCNDGLSCTADNCAAGKCTNTVQTGYCVINGKCVAHGAANPTNQCELCAQASVYSWTASSGSACDDAKACTYDDRCVKGVCKGKPFTCDDKLACTTDGCNTKGYCTFKIKAGYCAIGGACFASGAVNSTNKCLRCVPAKNTKAWTTVAASGCVQTVAGSGSRGLMEGGVKLARFDTPTGVAVDSAGKIYVADSLNHRVRVIHQGQVKTLAGSGSTGLFAGGFKDGPAASALFNFPTAVAVDSAGKVYVADTWNHRIRVVAGGKVSTLAGGSTHGLVNGKAALARFTAPHGLALGAQGKVYVADTWNHCIRLVAAGQVTTLAGQGQPGLKDGAAAVARFYLPKGVAVDSAGKIYVADSLNHRVRVVAGGQVSTLAGSAGSGPGGGGFLDGAALSARFNEPSGVWTASSGKVYVADMLNHRVRAIAAGNVTTLAGSGKDGYLDSSAKVAKFSYPAGLATGSAGMVYLADSGNHRVRVIVP